MKARMITFLFAAMSTSLVAQAQISMNTSLASRGEAEKPWLMKSEPSFPGGQDALEQYIDHHVQIPSFLMEQGFEGNLELLLVINAYGQLESASILNVPLTDHHQEELQASLMDMPCWHPAMQGGRAIPSKVLVPLLVRQQFQ